MQLCFLFSLCLYIDQIIINPVLADSRDPEQVAAIYRQAATLAAGEEHIALRDLVCPNPNRAALSTPSAFASPATIAARQRASTPSSPTSARTIPDISQWHTDSVKVFDELYFVGTQEHSAWAIASDDGIILIDTVFDYATQESIVEGLKNQGLDPAKIKTVIISHGHGDHHGGARYLQTEFGARIIMGEADWDLVASSTRDPIPRRDISAEDGMTLTMGNTSITLYLTPGHTDGTLSSIITVKDGDNTHTAALWGGTSIRPSTPIENVQLYIDSAVRFSNIAQKAGADVLLSNHLRFDGSLEKLPALAQRQAGSSHPYVVGIDTITRYLAVAENCARAEMAYR